ncbi:agmatinase [Candidatus Marsarchaeota G1 archaeon OSP_B]|jgi:agmatinase|uniref:Agmatinase n=5 Tax=Candidatus Marsarchaeota TaxID=1978152 RepID=A0A2R6AFP2_9ARCH|nr:MAG: agmatinase [Candidatus Marsarchaeota G1 archaeon OSP_D]PSN85153.1 MAG: agmatinase [Candidatus Marsarchaeota G1 archaeon BE_D]PSN89350.1 MAG: agmatinase [Candidatus Marsarchaeota G1 archaeon OSP_C]PSN92731.1 MAG: agmatinase [Candidatus Marsarchaeota G1 archaeon OSP_B]
MAKKVRQIDAMKSPRFTQVATFARLPNLRTLKNIHAVFLGIPFDDGTTYRTGARLGPQAIREQSRLLRPYNMFLDVSPFESLNVVDYGDVNVVPGYIQDTFKKIQKDVGKIVKNKVVPFIAGGDHSLTLPVLREIALVHGKINLLHFDSHFDFWDTYWGKKYTHGTWLRRAIEEGLLNRVAQACIRGSVYSKSDFEFARENAILVKTIREFHEKGVAQVMNEIRRFFPTNEPLYVSFDIDAVDPAFAGGTGTPEVGGITSWDALECIRSLLGYKLVGFDVVEVSPLFDPPSQNTALLAANLIYEALCVLAKTKSV